MLKRGDGPSVGALNAESPKRTVSKIIAAKSRLLARTQAPAACESSALRASESRSVYKKGEEGEERLESSRNASGQVGLQQSK